VSGGCGVTGPRLSIIPARAATDRSLKPRDLQVLCVLGRHTDDLGWCRRSQVKMADEMGCARSTVFEAVERLVKAGYLEKHEQEEVSGRDSAHWYRVILDPVHPNLALVREADEQADSTAEIPCRPVGTPAGISAPPAGPGPAPPAGPGPAPINDTSLTTPVNAEKERGREDDQKAVERWVKKTHPGWPSYISDSVPKAVSAAFALTAAERETAADRMAEYVASAKVGGRTVICTFAVYLAEKRWEKLPPKVEVAGRADDYAPPFGPVWMGWVMAAVIGGPENAGGATQAERWPKLDALYRLAHRGTGYRFSERWHALKGLMVAVPVGTPQWIEWRDHFARQSWPWLPDPGRVAYFPAGGPAGLEAFEQAVRGNHDAGGREAAE
ncbi:helix-turn-helix domain-containing protein, partial [Mesorhizobium sp. M7A.F.Ca.ET.027.02.1.1]|uniref:helix-turn-helix domain-containing protein n=1 Tax=Mesorhizobium sp. M7A.F.Ca.ET.027.02.1.1 TaxID=2496655 RepID=UPI001FE076C0